MSAENVQTAVIALGGNALSPPGDRATIGDQFSYTRASLAPIVDLALDGWRLCIVHGNGPQVGDELARNEAARADVEPLPLGVLVAATAGWIGYMVQQSLQNALRREGSRRGVATVITQIKVRSDDPALADPTKSIGHELSDDIARDLEAAGHAVKRDSEGRYRRVVGSPAPVAIPEIELVRLLVEQGTLVIACGGGGVPVYADEKLGLEGVDAVVDKDLAAALLARELGADLLLILTSVDAVYADWNTPRQRALPEMSVAEAEQLDSEGAFGVGSMAPKVRAAVDFVRHTGGRAVIAELSKGREAVRGVSGTTIKP